MNPSSSKATLSTTDEFFMVKGALYQATAGLISGSLGTATLQFMNAAGDWEDYAESDGTLPFNATVTIPQSGLIRWNISGGTSPVVAVDFVQLDQGAVLDFIAAGSIVNPDNVQTALAADPDGARAAIDAMPLPAVESLDSTVLMHDGMIGLEQTLTDDQTRTVRPGPGTMTAKTVTAPSLVRYENGRLLVSHAASTGYGTECHWGAHTIAPGLTAIFRFIHPMQAGATGQMFVGWSHNGGYAGRRGAVALTFDNTAPYRVPKVQISTLASDTDDTFRDVWPNLFVPGQEVAVAVRHTSATLQEYFIQSPAVANCGCAVGSQNWFKLGQTSGVTLSGTVYPYLYQQFSGVAEMLDVKVLSQWSPSPRHQQCDYERGKIGVHVSALMEDPVTGLLVAAWNNGTQHVHTDTKIRASVRLADGTWTAPVTVVAAPGAPAGEHIGSLSQVNGELWLTSFYSAAAEDGGTLYRRTLTIDPEDGTITVGSATVLSGLNTGDDKLAASPIITTAAGTLLIPYHNQTPEQTAFVGRSTDDGATWTPIQIAASMPAGTTWLVEPVGRPESAGAVGMYFRTTANVAYYCRSTDDGVTWTTPAAVSALPMPSNGNRMQVADGPDGRAWLAGCNDKTERRAITVWEIGDNAVVRGSYEIYDPFPDNGADINHYTSYPSIAVTGDDLVCAWSNQNAADSWIQLHTLRWTEPLAVEAGGTGTRGRVAPKIAPRPIPKAPSTLTFAAGPVPDLAVNNRHLITLTASTATIGVPLNPMPWEELEVAVVQGGSGSYTLAWNAIFQMNSITTTLQTAVGATNIFRFRWNPIQNKWVLVSFS